MTVQPTSVTPGPSRNDDPPRLPPTVVALGAVSLLNDIAGNMLNPLLPAFIAAIGGGPEILGLIEGVADAASSVLQLASGYLADRLGRLKAITFVGYMIAAVARPFLSLAAAWWQVLAIRFCDRVGKGVRSAPRDRLLADVTPSAARGRSYGFHRAMDHGGALVGPIITYVLLATHFGIRKVFACTALPGIASLFLLARSVKEPAARRPSTAKVEVGIPDAPTYRRFLLAVFLFTLGCASDAFLLWRAAEIGIPTVLAPLLWLVLAVVQTASSTYGGTLSDRLGRRRLIVSGWLVYGVVYAGFALAGKPWEIWTLFAAYGLFYGLSEAAERALVVDLVPYEWRGRALGAYNAIVGIALLPASVMFGIVYQLLGAPAAFLMGAGFALVAVLVLPHEGEIRPAQAVSLTTRQS